MFYQKKKRKEKLWIKRFYLKSKLINLLEQLAKEKLDKDQYEDPKVQIGSGNPSSS